VPELLGLKLLPTNRRCRPTHPSSSSLLARLRCGRAPVTAPLSTAAPRTLLISYFFPLMSEFSSSTSSSDDPRDSEVSSDPRTDGGTGDRSRREQDKAHRRRIGPWHEDMLPDLSSFEADQNFVVRAAAGSGKTTSLVARMVALIRRGDARASDLAAITFTRKAAGEMEGRFHKELRRARFLLRTALEEPTGRPDADLRDEIGEDWTPEEAVEADISREELAEQLRRVEAALGSVQQTFIGTVHAFCGRILREHAFEADLPPDFAVGIDDREFEQLQHRVWDRYITESRQERPERMEELNTLGLPPEDLTGLFETASHYPELHLYTNAPEELPDLTPHVEQAREFVETWQAIRPDPPVGERHKAQRALDKAEGMMRSRALTSPAQQAKFLQMVRSGAKDDGTGNLYYSRWGESGSDSYEAAKDLKKEAYPAFCEAIDPDLNAWKAYAHKQAVRFVEPAATAFLERRREEGQLTHHDVLYWTRTLLRDRAEIREDVLQRSPRLLVDEFQDTDPLQAEILFYLTAQDPEETVWRNCRPRPGSLFIVGDDKQSIYRFRRADIDVFREVSRQIVRAGGDEISLYRNFRSHGQILDFCDEAFEEIFAGPALPEGKDETDLSPEDRMYGDAQADYEDFIDERPGGADPTSIRTIDCDYVSRYPAQPIAEDDADQIARFIRSAIDQGNDHPMALPKTDGEAGAAVFPGGASPSDFLILTRKKSNLSVYVTALARRGVPAAVTGSKDLGQSDDLQDLVALLRAALRPDDPVATLAYLRSGLVGLSDGELYCYRQAAGSGPAAFAASASVPSDDTLAALEEPLAKTVEEAFRQLREVRQTLRNDRPATAFPKVVETTGLMAAASAPPNPSRRSLRAGRFARAVDLIEAGAASGASWPEITAHLHDLVHGEEEADGLTLDTGSEEAVQVMNVHQAKGLEAPVVFLADPAGDARGEATTHVLRPEGSGERAARGASSPQGVTNGDVGETVSRSDEDPEDPSDYLVAPVTEEGTYHTTITHAPLGWDTAREPTFAEIESAHERAEAHRLLYVAATRAKNLLVVSRPSKKDGSPAVKDPWGDLAEKIGEEVPVLDPPPVEADEPAPFSAPDSDRLDERNQSIARQSRPSFREESVSNLVHDASEESPPPEDVGDEEADPFHPVGYGKFFGTVVHNALEQWARRSRAAGSPAEIPAAEDLAVRLERAREEGAVRNETSAEPRSSSLSDEVLSAEAQSTIERFAKGPLAETVRDADVVYTEYPFALRTGATDRPADTSDGENEKPEPAPADADGTETAPETVLRGTIDLVYQDDDGWHIVDHKTDRIRDVGTLSALPFQHPYRQQVRRYARFWHLLTGEPVATASLRFTDSGTRVPVDGSRIEG